ncbi:Uncharacterized protein Rs2_23302 [Raphanus sativus]|nr:Uncharacterized protein Rs2_23302 [Raphanus sativus]
MEPLGLLVSIVYHCRRTVRIASSNPSEIACPRCLRQFVVEIEMRRPLFPLRRFATFNASPETRLLEALSLMFDPPSHRWIRCRPISQGKIHKRGTGAKTQTTPPSTPQP